MTETKTTTSKVREIRKALDYTQAEMADSLGCSHTAARRYEYDGTLPKNRAVLANLRKLAAKAGVKIETG